jgi:hypothetical protein
LNLADNDTIADVATNKLGGTGVSNGNFTGQVYTLDRTPPAASYGGQAPASNAATMDFTVTYTDAAALLDASTFDGGDITVTGPNSFSQNASFVSVNVAGNGTPRIVTYRITAPGGTWDASDNGTYTVSQNASQVKDTVGNFRAAGTIGTFVADLGTVFASQSGGTLNIIFDGAGAPIALGISGGNITVTRGATTMSFAAAGVSGIVVTGTGGDDQLDYNNTIAAPISLNTGAGNDVLNVNAGAYSFSTDASAGASNLTINVTGSASFTASQHLKAVNLTGGTASLTGASRVMVLQSISVAANSKFDLADNDLVITGMSQAAVETLVAAGRSAAGNWLGNGIMSSVANTFTGAGSRALAVLTAADGAYQFSSFAGESVAAGDILVKYTYSGDANGDGSVNFDDFNKFLAGYANADSNAARWFTGDFNYDGSVNFDDFNKFLSGYNAFIAGDGELL